MYATVFIENAWIKCQTYTDLNTEGVKSHVKPSGKKQSHLNSNQFENTRIVRKNHNLKVLLNDSGTIFLI